MCDSTLGYRNILNVCECNRNIYLEIDGASCACMNLFSMVSPTDISQGCFCD